MIDEHTRASIHRACQLIAARCDGARSDDRVGFNAQHSAYGRLIASLPAEAMSDQDVVTVYEMLRTYRGQLADLGVDYDALPVPEGAEAGPTSVKMVRAVVWQGATAKVVFGYDPEISAELKRLCRTARWDRAARVWRVSAADADALARFAEQERFVVSGEPARDVRPETPGPIGVLRVRDAQTLEIAFDGFHPDAVAAVKKLPGRRWDSTARAWTVPAQSLKAARRLAERLGLEVDPAVAELQTTAAARLSLEADQIGVRTPYLPALRDELRAIGGRWQRAHSRWLLPLEALDDLLATLDKLGLDVDEREVAALRDAAAQVEANLAGADALDAELPPIPGLAPGLELRPYQRAGVRWLVDHRSTFLGDEQGLGKTPTTLAALELAGAFPAVIVCPATLKRNWEREARRWLPGRETVVLSGTKPRPFGLYRPDIVVINYDIVGDWRKVLARDLRPMALVLDESQKCKDPKTLRTQQVKALSEAMPADAYRWCLSGTPITNRRGEYASQLDIMGVLEAMGGRTAVEYMGDIAARLRRAGLMIRRRKAQVLPDLPPVVWTPLEVEADPAAMAEYERAEAALLDFIAERAYAAAREAGSDDPRSEAAQARMRAARAEVLVRINTLRQLSAKAKLPAIRRWVDDFLESGEKLLLFAHHLAVLDDVQATFGCEAIRGGQSSEVRMGMVDRFQERDDTKLLALALTAGAEGLTLTAASNVLFVEQAWTPAQMDQAVARCIVEGQIVQTRRGAVPIEAVEVGDEVLTHRGRWRRVTATMSRRADEYVEVEAARHLEPLRCTPDHLLWVKDSVTGEVGWRRADQLTETSLLCLPRTVGEPLGTVEVPEGARLEVDDVCLGCSRRVEIVTHGLCDACRLRWRKKGRSFPEDYTASGDRRAVKIAEGPVQVTDELLFALGRWLGDGYLVRAGTQGRYRAVALCGHADEADAIERDLRTIAQAFGLDAEVTAEVRGAAAAARFTSVEAAATFERWFFAEPPRQHAKDTGGKGSQAVVKRLAPWMFGMADSQAWALLHGLLAADGHWRPDGSSSFVTVSPHLAQQVALLAAQVGFAPSVRVLARGGGPDRRGKMRRRAYDVRWQRREPTRMRHDLRLSDQDSVWSPVVARRVRRDEVTVYDLTVEDDHSFVVGQAAVHNCYGRVNDPHGAQGFVAMIPGTIDSYMAMLLEEKRIEFADAVDGEEYQAGDEGGRTSIVGELIEGLTDAALSGRTIRQHMATLRREG